MRRIMLRMLLLYNIPASAINLVRPALVHYSTTVRLPLLEQSLAAPLGHISSIHPPTRLAAEPCAVPPRGQAIDGGHVDAFARVELEGGLGAQDLQVDAGARVVGGEVHDEGGGARVDGDGGRVGGEGEAVVDVGLGGGQLEGLGGVELVGGGPACGDGDVVNGQVLVGGEGDGGALDGRGGAAREVEVGVVGHVDGRLVSTTNKLSLIVHAQHDNLLAPLLHNPRCVHNLSLHRPRKALIPILAHQRILDALPALQARDAGDLPLADGFGPVPDALAPALDAAVQGVAAVVVDEGVGLAAVEGVDLGAADAVGDAADRLAKVGAVVLFVLLLGVEALDDVEAFDLEGLDGGPEGDEGEWCVSHGGEVKVSRPM